MLIQNPKIVLAMTKTLYLVKTHGCSACKCQEYIDNNLVEIRPDIELKVCYFSELPKWLQECVSLTDFPTNIFVENETVKYHFVGTKSVKKILQLLEDIGF